MQQQQGIRDLGVALPAQTGLETIEPLKAHARHLNLLRGSENTQIVANETWGSLSSRG